MTQESLLDQDASQLRLWPGAEADDQVILFSGRNPTFTAARLFERDPECYQVIAALRAAGMTAVEVARKLGVSRNTVAAVDDRERDGQTVEQIKQGGARTYRNLARLAADRVRELLTSDEKLPLQQLTVAIGILEDKSQLLAGAPTSRVEMGESGCGRQEMLEYMSYLEARQTGLGGEKTGQRALPAPAPAPAGEDVGPAAVDGDAAIPGELGAGVRDQVTGAPAPGDDSESVHSATVT